MKFVLQIGRYGLSFIRVVDGYFPARMVELADTLDLGSSASAWGFESPSSHL